MKKQLVVVAGALSAVVLLTAFGSGRFGCGGTPEERFDRAKGYAQDKIDDRLDDLDATDAQRARIAELQRSLFAEARPLFLSHQQTKQELLHELQGQTPDAARLHALVDARVAAYQAMAHRLVDASVEVHALLTPEQRAELQREFGER
ncbi:MAG: Spy/CpxP family protein refolding chaperone [Myxococcota bacterium]|nr:Spy/CpxP family protein refolding chaperone [Myxococcota bacterium]